MSVECALGVDVGTSSTKGTLVSIADGEVLAQAQIDHRVLRPAEGRVESHPEWWWEEFLHVVGELAALEPAPFEAGSISAVGVSGMGPCVALTDGDDQPVRPAILYGVDTRATVQMERLTRELGEDAVVRIGGSRLTTQAVGPKIVWVADEEPEVRARAERLFMPSSYLVRRLTGEYVLDHQAASQCWPLYDLEGQRWYDSWWERYATGIEQPRLAWAGDVVGEVSARAAAATRLPLGTPVIAGTIDAWAEAISVDAHHAGDLMLMYGTTMFLIATSTGTVRTPSMWTTAGVDPCSRSLAGGLATSGAITTWIAELTGQHYAELSARAAQSPVGSHGLLMLPYFAGERTPILDPDARGVIAGLTLNHSQGDLYRAALEATAFAVRHNLDVMREAGADISRVVAVGGGTRGDLWLQIVSDVTGLPQQVPHITRGASYGAAYLAATAVSRDDDRPSIAEWNPIVRTVTPDAGRHHDYDELYGQYLALYRSTTSVVHALAHRQRTEGPRP